MSPQKPQWMLWQPFTTGAFSRDAVIYHWATISDILCSKKSVELLWKAKTAIAPEEWRKQSHQSKLQWLSKRTGNPGDNKLNSAAVDPLYSHGEGAQTLLPKLTHGSHWKLNRGDISNLTWRWWQHVHDAVQLGHRLCARRYQRHQHLFHHHIILICTFILHTLSSTGWKSFKRWDAVLSWAKTEWCRSADFSLATALPEQIAFSIFTPSFGASSCVQCY